MSSIITNVQRTLEVVAANVDLAIAAPFTALFTRGTTVIDMGSEQATIELFKGNRKVAPLVSRLVRGDDIENQVIRPGVTGANDYLYSLIQQELELDAGVLNKRIPGEKPYVDPGSEDVRKKRYMYWITKMYIDAMRRVVTRDELLAKQAYFDSEMDLGDTFQGATKLVFPRSATLKNRAVVAVWSDAANAKPWTDYGTAQREMKAQSQVDGKNAAISFLGSTAMANLKAIYISQKPGFGPDANMTYNEFDFNPDKDFPRSYQFLIDNGMEYGGWIRSDYANTKIHLFTLPEGYDATADDSDETYTDFIDGETITLALDSPAYFETKFGPGKKMPPSLQLYQNMLPKLGLTTMNPGNLTIGASGLPAKTMMLNIYDLAKNDGWGACLEHAPIFVPKRPDVVCTIDTLTAIT